MCGDFFASREVQKPSHVCKTSRISLTLNEVEVKKSEKYNLFGKYLQLIPRQRSFELMCGGVRQVCCGTFYGRSDIHVAL